MKKLFISFTLVLSVLFINSCGAQIDGSDISTQEESSRDDASKEDNGVSNVSSVESETSQVDLSEIPGEEELVITLAPVLAAPRTILIAAISLSA